MQVMINLPGSPGDKESPANAEDARDVGLIPGSEKSPCPGFVLLPFIIRTVGYPSPQTSLVVQMVKRLPTMQET